jgi:uncharacterized membrane protein YqjE
MAAAGSAATLAQTLKSVMAGVVSLAITRGELAAAELQCARQQALRWALLAVVVAALLVAALMTASLLVAAVFWDIYRWQAIAAVTLGYAVAAALVLQKLRNEVKQAPDLLALTWQELAKDREALGLASGATDEPQ